MCKSKGVLIVVAMLAVLTMIAAVQAADPVTPDAATGSVNLLAGEDMALARIGFTPSQVERVTVGPEVGYIEGVKDGPPRGVTVGFFGTYDLVKDATLDVLATQVPATWYVGVHGDGLFREGVDVDMTAGLMTGLRIGHTEVAGGHKWCAALGIEAQYLLTKTLWRELADVDDSGRLLVSAQIGWK
jgi:hypothetical protein